MCGPLLYLPTIVIAMQPLRVSLLLSLGFLVGTPALAQSGEDVLRFGQRDPGVGARVVGLAGAAVGGVGDWGAAAANPAALGLIGRSHVVVAFGGDSAESEASYAESPSDTRGTQGGVGSAAYVAALPTRRGSFVVGVGYNQRAALERDLVFGGRSDVPGLPGLSGEVYEEGLLGELSGVVAAEVAPGIYVGGAANLVIGRYGFRQFYATEAVPTGDVLSELDTDLAGFNLRTGVVAETLPGLRFGFALESPTWLYAEEAFERSGGEELFDYTLQTPWRAAAGVAYEQRGLLLTADVAVANWSEGRLRPSETFGPENIEIERDYRESVEVRVGAEYAIGLGAVRAGYAYQQDPLRDLVEPDRARRTAAAGLSLHASSRLTLDVAIAVTDFEDRFFVPFENLGSVFEEVLITRVLVGVTVGL